MMEGPTEEILEGQGLSFINSDIFFTLAKSTISILLIWGWTGIL